MIGVSLSPAALETQKPRDVWGKIRETYPTPEALLRALFRAGARSIELRPIPAGTDPDAVLRYVKLCLENGFCVTVHGGIKSQETAVEDIFAPLSAVLAAGVLRELKITVHALLRREDTVKALLALSDRAEQETCKITLCLENGRKYPDKSQGETSSYILGIVKEVNRKNVCITWDFGHMWSAVNLSHLGGREYLPDAEFIARTVHTHIHGLRLSDLNTHFPPCEENLPLSEWMSALSYSHVYNFEPEPNRWDDDENPAASLLAGVRAIAAARPLRSAALDAFNRQGAKLWERAARVFEGEENAFALTGTSGYLVKLDGTCFGMDLCFPAGKHPWYDAAAACLDGMEYCFLTHGHGDHADVRILSRLAEKNITWVAPDFLKVRCIPEEKIIRVKAGEVTSVGNLTVTVIPGRHYRPGTSHGIEEVGYFIEGEEKSVLFLGDVRDYDTEGFADYPNATALFAHLWTGDRQAQSEKITPELLAFANLAASFAPERVYVTHLFETGRIDESLWSYRAAGVAADEILRRTPTSRVAIPEFGTVYSLDD